MKYFIWITFLDVLFLNIKTLDFTCKKLFQIKKTWRWLFPFLGASLLLGPQVSTFRVIGWDLSPAANRCPPGPI